jgi:hypothetical protein
MTLALEINDLELALAGDGQLLAREPGYAMLDGAKPETGEPAARRVRLKPLFAESRHWQDLSPASLPRPLPAARTYADVAFAQLAAFVQPWVAQGPELLVAVPPGYTRDQLGLLLGMLNETGLRTVGVVDASVAACSLEPAPAHLLHLDIGLHRARVCVLDRAGELRRTRFELLPQHGWLALQQRWLDMIAALFVRKTRFDPLAQATTEQALCDGLPGWLAAVSAGGQVGIELDTSSGPQAIDLAEQDFVTAASSIYDEIARALQRLRPATGTLHLRVSSHAAALPGLGSRIGEIRDLERRLLPRGAAVLGALAFERNIRRDDGAIALVHRLPVPAAAGETTEGVTAAPRVPPTERPTHVVQGSRAYALDSRPLTLGSDVSADRRALRVPAGAGISRAHCTLTAANGAVWLEDHSTYGTFVNDERVSGKVELRAGDRLRLGSPGVEVVLVQVVEDAAATS